MCALAIVAVALVAPGARALRLGAAGVCTDEWQDFASGAPLRSTQVVREPSYPPHSFKDFDPGSAYQGVFVDPPSQFAFCTIEKNGCSAWTTVLHKILVNSTVVNHKAFDVSHKSFDQWGSDGAEGVFSNPAAVRAVMVRDPLARFASVFLDKCFDNMCGNPFCMPRSHMGKGQPISFEQALTWMLSKDPAKLDGHWKLQSEHCELKSRLLEYTVVGFMDKDTFARDAACILEHAGLSRFNDDGRGKPFFFEGASGVNQHLEGSEREEQVLRMLYTKEAARSLMQHMRQDYSIFHMEEPRWLAEATGEWYAKVPQSCEENLRMSNAPQDSANATLHELLMEDDVYATAKRVGYFE